MNNPQIVDEQKMTKMSVAPPDPEAGDKSKKDQREDEELDEGLEETFPASDPPANTQPGHSDPMPSSGFEEDDKKN